MSTLHLSPKNLAARWSVIVGHRADRPAGGGPAHLMTGVSVLCPLDRIEAYEADRLVMPVAAA